MSERRKFVLVSSAVRGLAARSIHTAPEGWEVLLQPPVKRREQEERYHAMLGDIAAQWIFMGRRWDRESMKRLLIDAFAQVMKDQGTPLRHDGSVVPSIDGQRVVQLGVQSRQFTVREASEFIEYLNEFGADHAIRWSDAGVTA